MKLRLSSHGNTAIEILIAVGLVGVVAMVIIHLSKDVLSYIRRHQTSTTRDQLATQFRQNVGRVSNLRLTLSKTENLEFRNCVCGQGPGCDTSKKFALTLFDPSTPDQAVPTYYDSAGVPCNKDAKNCIIEVTLGFIAQCKPLLPSADPTPATVCVGAPVEFIAVTYDIHQNPSTKSEGEFLKPISGSVFSQTIALAPAGSGVCP